MRIPKAKEILESCIEDVYPPDIQDYRDALLLGVEALKEVQRARLGDPALDGELLPGETVDQAGEG